MSRVKEALQIVALLVFIAFVAVLIWFAIQTKPKIDSLLLKTDTVLANLSTVTQQGAQAVAKLNAATDAETAKLQATTEEARKTERAFRAGIDSLRQVFIDLHQNVMPAVAKTVQDTDTAVLSTTADLHKVAVEAQPVIDNAARATASAADTLADPAIKQSLEHVAASTENIGKGTANLAGVTADAKDAADYELQQLKKPGSFWLMLLKTALGLGSQGRILIRGAK